MDTQPQEESEEPEGAYIATMRYFPLGKICCMACGRTAGAFVVRIAATPQNAMIMTLLCEDCGRMEIDGLVEGGHMRDEGGLLINPKYEQTLLDSIVAAGENAQTPPEKVPTELEAAGLEDGTDG